MRSTPVFIICLFSFLVFTGCKKKESDPPESTTTTTGSAPDPYTYNPETESSKDISFATFIVADLDMIVAYPGEDIVTGLPYESVSNGTVTVVRNIINNNIFVSFNNAKCRDGRTRSGTVGFSYNYDPVLNPTSNSSTHFRDFSFAGYFLFFNYVVDGWKVETFDPDKPMYVYNDIPWPAIDPTVTDFDWNIKGKLKLTNTKNEQVIWDGNLRKKLDNAKDTLVYSLTRKKSINWNLSKLSYTGIVTGSIGASSYTYNVNYPKSLTRDFTCQFSGTSTVTPAPTHFFPFISGVAGFTISNLHPRSVDYGPTGDCDNKGKVTLKNETYDVDFN
jgi:hypothetical protein